MLQALHLDANEDRTEALIVAARRGLLDTVDRLIRVEGVDVNVRTQSGRALDAAICSRKAAVVARLIEAGAHINPACSRYMGKYPMPLPLTSAISVGSPEIVELLLSAGAKISPATLYVAMENIDILKLLLGAVEGGVINEKDCAGFTLLMRATTADIARALLAAGAQVDARDVSGRTALMCRWLSVEVAKVLLAAGANVDAKDCAGQTALMMADTVEKVELLLAAGADVNATDLRGRTVLMHASGIAGGVEIIRLLLAAGAGVDATDPQGMTALDFAKNSSVAEVLLLPPRGESCLKRP